MPMVIRAKPGTHAGISLRVKGRRKALKADDVFYAKPVIGLPDKIEKYANWERWRVIEIRGDLHVLERW